VGEKEKRIAGFLDRNCKIVPNKDHATCGKIYWDPDCRTVTLSGLECSGLAENG
jgi:hypothetical protein